MKSVSRYRLMAFLVAFTMTVQETRGVDYVINGDFSAGNTGFQSTYVQSNLDTAANQYNVISGNGQTWNTGFVSFTGPGGSSDMYFVADAGPSATAFAWQQTTNSPAGVTVTTDVNNPYFYRFEAQILWADPDDGVYMTPDLSFEFKVESGAFNALTSTPNFKVPGPGNWVTVYADGYFLTTPSSFAYQLRNQQTAFIGNDFAIDNIYFGPTTTSPSYQAGRTTIRNTGNLANPTFIPVPEPSAYALSTIAMGLIALAARRRRTTNAFLNSSKS